MIGYKQFEITLVNPRDANGSAMIVQANIDPHTLHVTLPKKLVEELQLVRLYDRWMDDKDGNPVRTEFVGPIELKYNELTSSAGAIVFGDEVFVGCTVLDDLLISPKMRFN